MQIMKQSRQQKKKNPRWWEGRDASKSAALKQQRLHFEEANGSWIVENHSGCAEPKEPKKPTRDAIRKTIIGDHEQHLSCYDKITGKHYCYSARTLLLLYLHLEGKFLEPPTFQNQVKPSTLQLIRVLLKNTGKVHLSNEEEKKFRQQFVKYLGGQLPKAEINCCPVCYVHAQGSIKKLVDPLGLFAELHDGNVLIKHTTKSCFLSRTALKLHMAEDHQIYKEANPEMNLTLDQFLLRCKDGLIDRYYHSVDPTVNFRHHYWKLEKVKLFLGMYQHLKCRGTVNSKSTEIWQKLVGVTKNTGRDEAYIMPDSEVEVDPDKENHRGWLLEQERSEEEPETEIEDDEVEDHEPAARIPPRKRKKYVVVDSDEESESDTEMEDSNKPDRCCMHCLNVEMVEMTTRKYGCDQISCDGVAQCPQKGYPLGKNERFYGCKNCNEYDLCAVCYNR